MQFLEEEILEITETTWNALLGLDIQPSSTTNWPPGAGELLRGRVDISGGWEGTVILYGTPGLARSAASKIFSVGPDAVKPQDQIDTIYELTNIIAGNIKSLLPEPCQLAVPEVALCSDVISALPGALRISELYFECHGQPLLVTLWKRDKSDVQEA